MFIVRDDIAPYENDKLASNWKVNKGQRILEIEQGSVKKYISDRQRRIVNLPPRPIKIVTENEEKNMKLTVKQRLRTEIATRPSFHQNEPEMEQFSWQRNLTNVEKKNLLDNLVKNYHKFKKITDKSVENNRNFMPVIKRPAFSAKYEKIVKKHQHQVSLSKERVKTCAVYEKGEGRIRNIFEGNYEAEIFNKENKKNSIKEKKAEEIINNENMEINKMTPLKQLEFQRKRIITQINKLKEKALNQ